MNMELFHSVFMMQNPSRNRRCNDAALDLMASLAPVGCTIVRKAGNMLIRKGAASGPHPYYLAHLDQVHDYVPFFDLRIKDGVLSAVDGNFKQVGVGGDDKCGIFVALSALHALPHVTVVFVRDEEVGCEGSRIVPLSWFDHAAFVIQADRNNRSFDIIRDTNGMCCASDEFIAAMYELPAAANHSDATGTVTDIGELASRGLKVSMVNISSGYHDPHSKRETVVLSELQVCLDLCLQAGCGLGLRHWPHTPTDTYYGGAYGGAAYGYATSKYTPPKVVGGKFGGDTHEEYFAPHDDDDDEGAAADALKYGDDPYQAAFDDLALTYYDLQRDRPYKNDEERAHLIESLESLGLDEGTDMLQFSATEDLRAWLAALEELDAIYA
jgi:hypothetical protein